MTPKEKAEELLFKMDTMPDEAVMYFTKDEVFETIKKAALICAEELINQFTITNNNIVSMTSKDDKSPLDQVIFWTKVKQEIEKL